MSTTFLTLQKETARILNLLDSSGNIQTGKDITATDIKRWLNEAYLDEVVPRLNSQFPHYFEQEAYGPNWTIGGTVNASSTGTTLVMDDPILTSSMVGQIAYNVTDSTSATITAFTSTTTVTLDTTIGDTWDGDTVYIIDTHVVFEGDSVDLYALRYVGIKYKSTDTYYKTAYREDFNSLFQTGSEVYSENNPVYVLTAKKTNGVQKDAIEIFPRWEVPFSKAIYIKYSQIPAELSGDTDVPRLPLSHQNFLKWGAIKQAGIERIDSVTYQLAEREFEKGMRNLEIYFRQTTLDRSVKIKVPRKLAYLSRRIY